MKQAVCEICGKEVPQVSSATPELAMFQHMLWIHDFIKLLDAGCGRCGSPDCYGACEIDAEARP